MRSCPRPRSRGGRRARCSLSAQHAAQIAVLASVKGAPLNERLAPVEIVGAALVLTGIAGAGGALEFIVGGRNRKSGRLPGRPKGWSDAYGDGLDLPEEERAHFGLDFPAPLIGFGVARLAERQPSKLNARSCRVGARVELDQASGKAAVARCALCRARLSGELAQRSRLVDSTYVRSNADYRLIQWSGD